MAFAFRLNLGVSFTKRETIPAGEVSMSDWFDQKQQQMAAKAREEGAEREIHRQVLVTVPHFWEDMLRAVDEGANKWNQHRGGRKEIYTLDASGLADTKAIN